MWAAQDLSCSSKARSFHFVPKVSPSINNSPSRPGLEDGALRIKCFILHSRQHPRSRGFTFTPWKLPPGLGFAFPPCHLSC